MLGYAWPAALLESAATARNLDQFTFEKVPLDQALARERRGFQDPLVVPLLEEVRVREVFVGQIAWTLGCRDRLPRSLGVITVS